MNWITRQLTQRAKPFYNLFFLLSSESLEIKGVYFAKKILVK